MLKTRSLALSSFWLKAGIGALLVALADRLFLFHEVGSTLGAFAITWTIGVILLRPGLLKEGRALVAILAGIALGLVMLDRPHPVAWLLFGLALTLAVLSARVRAGEPTWRWGQRLVVHGLVSVCGPVIDLLRLGRYGRRGRATASGWATVRLLVLPLVGGTVFLLLFASANPIISEALDSLRLPPLSEETLGRIVWWGIFAMMIASVLRPRWKNRLIDLPSLGQARMPGVTGASITLSLIVFNLVFAIQNALDIAFLWSGAPLPGDMGLADYAHRGAYPLIATALLAGLFVLVALRPDMETAKRPLVRGLVVVWIGQNMLLVASSMLRTADYIEAYALTRFRIAALIWMVMVGLGLLLICWRMLKGRDGNWLIDMNVRLVLVVLALVSVVDLGAFAAAWNVRHAREVGGRGVELDVGYLHTLGAPALVSLVELEQRTAPGDFRARIAWVRQDILRDMRDRQSEWRGWTWRDARRLERVDALIDGRPLIVVGGDRLWDGRLRSPPPPPAPPISAATIAPAAPAPLTPTQGH